MKKIEAAKIELPASTAMVSANKIYSLFKLCFVVMVYNNFISLNLQFYLQPLLKEKGS